ncbi:MAG TPA: hypothetical protein PLP17_04940 [Oligoflexia bacterium]|nr:hypothetical protein [Oligoflexia bacterium]
MRDSRYLSTCCLLLLCAAASFSACAKRRIDASSLTAELRSAPLEIDVFAARAFLGGSEYERYYLNHDILWRECGKLSPAAKKMPRPANLAGDAVFPDDPSLTLVTRRVEKLSADQELQLKVAAAELLKTKAMSDEKEPLPGSAFSLSEPGTLEMSLVFGASKLRIVTSVDGVADKETPALSHVSDLLSFVRGIGPVICEAETFYGVPRKQ